MFDQDFRLLSRNELDAELSRLFRRWDASPLQRAEFVGWAWIVAAAADVTASEQAEALRGLLGAERELADRQLADHLTHSTSVDLYLVSKRMFLDWLGAQLAGERRAA
jgi:hypothetical protein